MSICTAKTMIEHLKLYMHQLLTGMHCTVFVIVFEVAQFYTQQLIYIHSLSTLSTMP